jgi:hypothetical protein
MIYSYHSFVPSCPEEKTKASYFWEILTTPYEVWIDTENWCGLIDKIKLQAVSDGTKKNQVFLNLYNLPTTNKDKLISTLLKDDGHDSSRFVVSVLKNSLGQWNSIAHSQKILLMELLVPRPRNFVYENILQMSQEEWHKLSKRFFESSRILLLYLTDNWPLFVLMLLNDPKIPDFYITKNLVSTLEATEDKKQLVSEVSALKNFIVTSSSKTVRVPIFPAPLSRFNLLFPMFLKSKVTIPIREVWITLLKAYPRWQSIVKPNPKFPLDEIMWQRSQGKTPHVMNYFWSLHPQDFPKWERRFGEIIPLSCQDINKMMKISLSQDKEEVVNTLLERFQFKNQCTSPESLDLLSIASLLKESPEMNVFFAAVLKGVIQPDYLRRLIESSTHLTKQQKKEILDNYSRWLQILHDQRWRDSESEND